MEHIGDERKLVDDRRDGTESFVLSRMAGGLLGKGGLFDAIRDVWM